MKGLRLESPARAKAWPPITSLAAARSSTWLPMAMPTRKGSSVPRRRNTPNGRFWIGKSGWPFADSTHIKVGNGIPDEKVLFLSDILPTGWQAAVQADIQPHDTVAIWGCGPVGQMTIRSAVLLGAKQVVAIDDVPERLVPAGAAHVVVRAQRRIQQAPVEVERLAQGRAFDAQAALTGAVLPVARDDGNAAGPYRRRDAAADAAIWTGGAHGLHGQGHVHGISLFK